MTLVKQNEITGVKLENVMSFISCAEALSTVHT